MGIALRPFRQQPSTPLLPSLLLHLLFHPHLLQMQGDQRLQWNGGLVARAFRGTEQMDVKVTGRSARPTGIGLAVEALARLLIRRRLKLAFGL